MKKAKEVVADTIENIVDLKGLMNKLVEKVDGEQFVRIVGAALIAIVTMGNAKGGE